MIILYMSKEQDSTLVNVVNMLDVIFEFALPLPLVVVVNCIVIFKVWVCLWISELWIC